MSSHLIPYAVCSLMQSYAAISHYNEPFAIVYDIYYKKLIWYDICSNKLSKNDTIQYFSKTWSKINTMRYFPNKLSKNDTTNYLKSIRYDNFENQISWIDTIKLNYHDKIYHDNYWLAWATPNDSARTGVCRRSYSTRAQGQPILFRAYGPRNRTPLTNFVPAFSMQKV